MLSVSIDPLEKTIYVSVGIPTPKTVSVPLHPGDEYIVKEITLNGPIEIGKFVCKPAENDELGWGISCGPLFIKYMEEVIIYSYRGHHTAITLPWKHPAHTDDAKKLPELLEMIEEHETRIYHYNNRLYVNGAPASLARCRFDDGLEITFPNGSQITLPLSSKKTKVLQIYPVSNETVYLLLDVNTVPVKMYADENTIELNSEHISISGTLGKIAPILALIESTGSDEIVGGMI